MNSRFNTYRKSYLKLITRKTVSSQLSNIFLDIWTKIECPTHAVENSNTFLRTFKQNMSAPCAQNVLSDVCFYKGRTHKTETLCSKNPKERLLMMR